MYVYGCESGTRLSSYSSGALMYGVEIFMILLFFFFEGDRPFARVLRKEFEYSYIDVLFCILSDILRINVYYTVFGTKQNKRNRPNMNMFLYLSFA